MALYGVDTHTVIFKDYDDSQIGEVQIVAQGKAATAPADPVREGYIFAGWDKDFSKVTSDLEIKAKYEKATYSVTFFDWNGTEISKQTVTYGENAIVPENPTREGYDFTGWSNSDKLQNVTGNVNAIAQYSIKEFTVTFKDGDQILKTQTVSYGSDATAPKAPEHTGEVFTGWSKSFDSVKSNIETTAQYAAKTYTVTFYDYDGKVLKTEIVNHGSAATAPEITAREGYNFTGWSNSDKLQSVTENISAVAVYIIKEFTVTFKDGDQILKTQKVSYGSDATAPKAPEHTGEVFTGWNQDFTSVKENIIVSAQYSEAVFGITATAGDNGNVVLESDTVNNEEKTATFNVAAVEGYRVRYVMVDGVNIGKVDSYTFENVTENHVIHVEFEEDVSETEPTTEPTTESTTEPVNESWLYRLLNMIISWIRSLFKV